jgi:hypothetical protein
MTSTPSTPPRLRWSVRALFGVLAVFCLVPVAIEIAVRGLDAWKFLVAATGWAVLLLFSATTGRRFWPSSK